MGQSPMRLDGGCATSGATARGRDCPGSAPPRGPCAKERRREPRGPGARGLPRDRPPSWAGFSRLTAGQAGASKEQVVQTGRGVGRRGGRGGRCGGRGRNGGRKVRACTHLHSMRAPLGHDGRCVRARPLQLACSPSLNPLGGMMKVNSLNHFKSVFAGQFFVKSADQNYALARWARIVGLAREFFIQAHQAVEKYLKAALVLNDVSVRAYQHDIVGLFEEHTRVFGDLAVVRLEKPELLNPELWLMSDAREFINHLEVDGNPNSRYRLTSYAARRSDLFTLDELVRRVRRLTVGLNWRVGQDWTTDNDVAESEGQTFRETLTRHPRFQPRGSIVPLPMADNESSYSLSRSFLTGNVAFVEELPPEYHMIPGTVAPRLGPMENSYLYLVAEALRSGEASQDVHDGTIWIVDNIYLPTSTRDELRRLALGA